MPKSYVQQLVNALNLAFSTEELTQIAIACDRWYGTAAGPSKLQDVIEDEIFGNRDIRADLHKKLDRVK